MDKPAPDEQKQRHANTIHSYPWNSESQGWSTNRTPILLGKVDAAFGSDQSLDVASNDVRPPFNPKKWHKKGRCLRVPKCVILSSLPMWTLASAARSYFYAPRAVIGTLLGDVTRFGNYYMLSQWDEPNDPVSTENYGIDDPNMLSSTFWDQFDPPVPDADKELYTSYYDDLISNRPLSGQNVLGGGDTPSERFSQKVGTLNSVYYTYHQQLLASFTAAKAILESDPNDPIYVTIPVWLPPSLAQKRNGSLKFQREKRKAGRGGECQSIDVVQCNEFKDVAWGPYYPDAESNRNDIDFEGCKVPWLATCNPGFGTNVLHMYAGHPCVSFTGARDAFGYQAWPMTSEAWFIGPVIMGTYLGSPFPFFRGRRTLWRDQGLNYGFLGHGVGGVYNYYSGIYAGGAERYKQHFYKYRNFGTRIFNYPSNNTVEWSLENIWKDYKEECPGTRFYFGFSFAEYSKAFADEDVRYVDCAAQHNDLRVAEAYVRFPPAQGIREALSHFLPPIRQRVDDYYSGIESGSAGLFASALEANGLSECNVKFEGACSVMLDPEALVEYIRAYFAENR